MSMSFPASLSHEGGVRREVPDSAGRRSRARIPHASYASRACTAEVNFARKSPLVVSNAFLTGSMLASSSTKVSSIDSRRSFWWKALNTTQGQARTRNRLVNGPKLQTAGTACPAGPRSLVLAGRTRTPQRVG